MFAVEAALDALVWMDALSLPTTARIKKQIESGAVVFLEKDCAVALRRHSEIKDLIPEPSKKSFDLVKKKNVVVYTIRGEDPGSKDLKEEFHTFQSTDFCVKKLDRKNMKIIAFVNRFIRYANGDQ